MAMRQRYDFSADESTSSGMALMLVDHGWAAAGFVDTDLSFSSRFKLCRADVAQRRVSPSRVVEPRDVVEYV